MRWFWIDRVEEFESGKRAVAVKNISLSEEHLHDHVPGFPVMPGSLMLEGMAQTGGILVGETHGFKHIVVLAKVPNVTFHSWAQPGDSLRYEVTLMDVREEGGMVECKATCGDRLVAEAEIFFAHVDQTDAAPEGSDQRNFVFELGLLDVLDVGKAGTGG